MKKKTAPDDLWSERLPRVLFCMGVAALAFVFLTFALPVLGFAVKVPITSYHLPAALLGTGLVCAGLSWHYYGGGRRVNVRAAALMMGGILALLLVSGGVAHGFYDTSYDGQWYHQGAVIWMADGYNPFYDSVIDTYAGAVYINCYPKSLETSAAVIYAFTHNIQDGKLLGVFLIVTSFLLALPAIAFSFPRLSPWHALVIAGLCAFNPVSIYQSLSYYVDGVAASALTILVFLLIMAYKRMEPVLYAAIAMAIIVSVNYKFFELAYVGIIVAGFVAILAYYRRAGALHYLLVVPLIVGVLFGANPYITNTLGHGNPFYPAEGLDSPELVGNTPANMTGRNPLELFALSVFAESSASRNAPALKLPLTIAEGEGEAFKMPDARVGGFGPLFSAALVLAALTAIVLVIMDVKEKRVSLLVLVSALVLASALVNPASWWARYVPQVWLAPLLLLACACYRFKGYLKLVNVALALVLTANVLYIACVYYPAQSEATDRITGQLDELKSASFNRDIALYPAQFPPAALRLDERGIPYRLAAGTPGNGSYALEATYGLTRFTVTNRTANHSSTNTNSTPGVLVGS